MNQLHADFRKLAAARKIMARPAASLDAERAGAERWVSRFGAGPQAGAPRAVRGEYATVIHPARDPQDAQPSGARVFYIHGGGMVYYSSATFAPLLQYWADRLATPIEAFDYGKLPEHTVGVSVGQLVADIRAQIALDPGRPVILGGDSVGGLLALYIATRALPHSFSQLCLIYPVLALHAEHASYADYGAGYFLDASAMRRFRAFLAPWFGAQNFDPFALGAAELAALPPCQLFSAGCDVLGDEAGAWAAHQGATVRHHQFADLPHDFCLYFGALPSAERAVLHILSTLKPAQGASHVDRTTRLLPKETLV